MLNVESFWAYRHREYVRVPVGEIQWIGAERDYVRLHTPAGAAGLLRETLTNVETMLDPETFIRVHRSVIVRRSEIVAVRRKRSGALLLTLASGAELPVGRSYAPGLNALLASMRRGPRPGSDGAAGED